MECPISRLISDSSLSACAHGGNLGPVFIENGASVQFKNSVAIPLTKSQTDVVEKHLATIFGDDAPSCVGLLICSARPSRCVSFLRDLPLPPGV